jgi:hypothetical protein
MTRIILALALLAAMAGGAWAQGTATAQTGGAQQQFGIRGETTTAASALVLKGGQGNVYSAYATSGGSAGYLMLVNAATAPSSGATLSGTNEGGTLLDCVYVPANTTVGLSYGSGPGGTGTLGAVILYSSTGCTTYTSATPSFMKGSVR